MTRKERGINLVFLLGLLLFLLIGLCRTIFWPKTMNYYENRYAHTIEAPSPGSIWSSAFQDSMERALSDQVTFSGTMKSAYHRISNTFQVYATKGFVAKHPDMYITLLGQYIFGGEHLVYGPVWLSDFTEKLDQRIQNLNYIIDKNPSISFFVYYIEKDTDVDFVTGRDAGVSAYLEENLQLPDGHFGEFLVNDFATFQRNFYRTDHHWNCYGSYLGYTQVLRLLDPSAEAMVPVEEVLLPQSFSGSKAATVGAEGILQEQFPAYRFDYPPMDITINGKPAEDYGNQAAYLNGTADGHIGYGAFYGGDMGEIVFQTHPGGKDNILVIGESYDNAILKLLASHYDNTYSVDLRYYEAANGKPFHFSQYVQEHDISTVLLIGNMDFFRMDDFALED